MSTTLSTTTYKTIPKVVSHVLHGFCDICWGSDNHPVEGMRLQRCCRCGVNFHCECYGIVAAPPAAAANPKTTKDHRANHNNSNNDLQCFACQAIGKTVHTRARDRDTGERIALTVTERPTECCLCGVDNGHDFLHAMHPLFDDHGPRGRQIVLKPTATKPYLRLAWAHTLCCLTISTHSGCVYGCMQDGRFAEEKAGSFNEDEEEEDDNESINSVLTTSPKDGVVSTDVTHFVYLHTKNATRDAKYFEYFKHMEEAKQLKCFVCGKNDKFSDVYRLPVQCCANDPKEFDEFKHHHDLVSDSCYQACHVGCAAWYRQPDGSWPSHRHVFFFPGDKDQKPVANVFCTTHALDVERQVHAKRGLRYQYIAPVDKICPAGPATKEKATTATTTTSAEIQQKTMKRHPLNGASDKQEPTPKKAVLEFKTNKEAGEQGKITKEKAPAELLKTHQETIKRQPVNGAGNRQVPTPNKALPATPNLWESHLKKQTKEKISESKRQKYDDSELEQKFLEIVEDIREHCNQSNDSLESILKTQKIDWKEKLNVPQNIFNSLWSKVVTSLQKDK